MLLFPELHESIPCFRMSKAYAKTCEGFICVIVSMILAPCLSYIKCHIYNILVYNVLKSGVFYETWTNFERIEIKSWNDSATSCRLLKSLSSHV